MTLEETQQLASEILNDILAKAESDPDKQFEVSRTNGEIKLLYRYHGRSGALVFAFFPYGLVEFFLTENKDLIEDIFSPDITVEQGEKKATLRDFLNSAGEDEHSTEIFTRIATHAFIYGLYNKFSLALGELCGETLVMAGARLQSLTVEVLTKMGLDVKGCDYRRDDMKAILASMAAERKDYLTRSLDSFSRKPKLEKLSANYGQLLTIWKDVKKIYARNGDHQTWRDMARAKYPEVKFYDDLLTRVTGKFEDLPQHIQVKLADRDGDHTPSTIALEHAARMCGAMPYQYAVGYLRKVVREKTDLSDSNEVRKLTDGDDLSNTE